MLRLVTMIVLVGALWSLPAYAQQTTTLSATQLRYNEDAVQDSIDGRYDDAIKKFRSSLAISEANITWLNLGRTYARKGDCEAARKAYDRAEDAPAVAAPTREEVAAVLERYREELATQECVDPVEQPADEPPVETEPDTPESPTAEAPDDEPDNEPAIVAIPKPEKSGPHPLETTGLLVGSIGAFGLAVGILLDQTWVKSARNAYEDGQGGSRDDAVTALTVNRVIFATGAGLLLTGVVLWAVAPKTDEPTGLTLHVGPDGLRIGYAGRF